MWKIVLSLVLTSLEVHAVECVPFKEQEFSPQALINFVNSSKNLNVEDVLCKLPVSLRSQYSIEFFSEVGAAQEATTSEPRVHLFNDRFVLTFNGSSKQKGGDDIEFGYVNHSGPLHDAALGDLLLAGPTPQFRSPEKLGCLSCHGSTEKPSTGTRFLFNASPFWEGFFGSAGFGGDDGLGEYYIKEKEVFENFKKIAPQHPRYKYLVDLDKRFLSSAEFLSSPLSKETPNKTGEYVFGFVNQKYSQILAEMNHDRLAQVIMGTPHYNEYKFAIFGALATCPEIDAFLPSQINALHTNENYLYPYLHGAITDKMLSDAMTDLESKETLKGDPFGIGRPMTIVHEDDSNELHSFKYFLKNLKNQSLIKFYWDSKIRQEFYGAAFWYAQLRYLFEGRNPPVSMREWSIDPKKGFYRFNNDERVDDDEVLIPKRLRVADPELAAIKEIVPFDFDSPTPDQMKVGCDKLQELSLARLSDKNVLSVLIAESKVKPVERAGFQVLQHECKTCHTLQVMDAPLFPMEDQKEFELLVTSYKGFLGKSMCDRVLREEHQPGIMPKYGPLSESDKTAILTYLASLGIKSPCQ